MTKLYIIFNKQNKFIFLFLLFLGLANVNSIYARDAKTGTKHTVKGIVRDKNTGEALTGVLIKENSSHWTLTDENGVFTLNVADTTPTLDAALPGYQLQQVTVSDPSHSQTIELVEATFSSNKTSQTSTVSKIGSEIIEQEQTINTVNALAGRASGVAVENGKIKIRGQSNVQDELSEPLVIIDGVQLPSGFNWSSHSGQTSPLNILNSSSIESIEILKDSDATAIYGGKGANGVVIINTKKITSSKLQLSASASAGVTGVTEWYDFLTTEEYLDIRRKAFEADAKLGLPAATPTESNAYDLLIWGDKYHTDWQKEFVGQTGKVYDGQVSLSGGNKHTSFYLHADYFETGNVLLAEPDDKTKRLGTRLLVNHRGLDDKLDITASFAFNTFNSKSRGLDPDTYLVYAPNQPVYNDDGSLYWLNSSVNNPLRVKYANTENKNTTLITNLQTHYRFLPDFDAIVDFGYTKNTTDQFQSYRQNYLNPYATSAYRNRVLAGDSYSDIFIVEPRLNYTRTIGKGALTVLLGATYQINNLASDDFELRDFASETMFRNYSAAGVRYDVNSDDKTVKRASLYARASYDFAGRYLFSGIVRRDGSSIFAKKNRYGNFWSIAGAWIFSGEEFVRENLGFLNYGKLKISHGITGNDNVADFQHIDAYETSSYPYEGNAGLYLLRVSNPDFTWEKTRKSEVALDIAVLDNRLQIGSAFYFNRSYSLIDARPLASQAGIGGYSDNIPGIIIENKGFELELVSTNVKTEKFQWFTTLTFTLPNNNIIKEFPNVEITSYATTYKVGESKNIVWGYKYTGINPENGVPTVEDLNGDGKITSADDKQFLRDTDPDYYGGLHNSFRYRNLQLDVFFYFTKRPFSEGYLKTYYYPLGYVGRNIPRKYATDYWTPENPGASRPGLTTTTTSDIGYAYYYYYTESDAFYSDASYISLKNVALAYTLPQSVSKKIKAKVIRLYVKGENLLTISKFDEWNPETKSSIPPFRTITAGINLGF
ncbi:MAG: SusC/RagA family TonB-linked outer membrane protein [Prevotellaceae bacterium]|jgi:TonB-linked SusC/RagA family outer membrane protein|nr:SusC/RagA family TonB-linked outer membrane protein [Prevotellaceae bacterium]